jgi:hypothetical protein
MKCSYFQIGKYNFVFIIMPQDCGVLESFKLSLFDYQFSYEHKPKLNKDITIVRTTGMIVKIRNIINIYFNTLFTLRSEITSLS